MPEAVVDQLEVVDVQEHHGGVRHVRMAARQDVAEAIEEQGTVREPGQWVVQRVVPGRLLGAPAGDGGAEHVGDGLEEQGVLVGEPIRALGMDADYAERPARPRNRHDQPTRLDRILVGVLDVHPQGGLGVVAEVADPVLVDLLLVELPVAEHPRGGRHRTARVAQEGPG